MSLEDNPLPDYGDFVGPDDEFEVEGLAEPRERYFQGLPYYPICIGDVLDQRYRIEHKLGHGGYSTVWMAYDMQTKCDVALKIHVPGSEGENELNMQNEIILIVQDTSNLLTYKNSFYVRDYDSQNHLVLVFPVWGPSLGSCFRQMSTSARMSATKQLLKALESLHGGGIVQRGKSIIVTSLPLSVYANIFYRLE